VEGIEQLQSQTMRDDMRRCRRHMLKLHEEVSHLAIVDNRLESKAAAVGSVRHWDDKTLQTKPRRASEDPDSKSRDNFVAAYPNAVTRSEYLQGNTTDTLLAPRRKFRDQEAQPHSKSLRETTVMPLLARESNGNQTSQPAGQKAAGKLGSYSAGGQRKIPAGVPQGASAAESRLYEQVDKLGALRGVAQASKTATGAALKETNTKRIALESKISAMAVQLNDPPVSRLRRAVEGTRLNSGRRRSRSASPRAPTQAMRSDETAQRRARKTSPRKTRPGTGADEQLNNRKRAWARALPVITRDVDESVQSVREPCVNIGRDKFGKLISGVSLSHIVSQTDQSRISKRVLEMFGRDDDVSDFEEAVANKIAPSRLSTMSIATTLAQQKRQLNASKCSLGVVAADSYDAGMAMSDLALEDIIKDLKAQNAA
jgi:hypothetical protein